MEWTMNEILLYGGLIVAAIAVVASIISIFVFKLRLIRINECFDQEYGKKEKEGN